MNILSKNLFWNGFEILPKQRFTDLCIFDIALFEKNCAIEMISKGRKAGLDVITFAIAFAASSPRLSALCLWYIIPCYAVTAIGKPWHLFICYYLLLVYSQSCMWYDAMPTARNTASASIITIQIMINTMITSSFQKHICIASSPDVMQPVQDLLLTFSGRQWNWTRYTLHHQA